MTNGWVDEDAAHSLWVYPGREGRNVLYEPEGALNAGSVERLKRLLTIADELDTAAVRAAREAAEGHYLVAGIAIPN